MKRRLDSFKKNQKGFTLVELIVVLVILAILAALLVPALLGYIDRARNTKYLEEARSIFTALQAVNDEQYAAGKEHITSLATGSDGANAVNKLVSPTEVSAATIVYLDTAASVGAATDKHKYYTVSYITGLTFKSQDGSTVTVSMKTDGSGTWDADNMNITAPSSGG
ncbi:MAG: prepilin-type N-terminal cleavage/methylation domain-containing protein [Lachnospiraceae bacterium]|nr:prepilin-type N-terminal cleavage/methylation domain-containing protein [Lachnospiraceae bacterium]